VNYAVTGLHYPAWVQLSYISTVVCGHNFRADGHIWVHVDSHSRLLNSAMADSQTRQLLVTSMTL